MNQPESPPKRRRPRRGDDPDPLLESVSAPLALAISSVGSNGFGERLADMLEGLSGYTSTVVAALSESTKPVRLFSNLNAEEEGTTLRPYFDGTYLLDPWYNMASSQIEDGVYRFSECVPDGFRKSEYYLTFYATTGLTDECGIFVRLSKQICLVTMLGIRASEEGDRKRGQLSELRALFPAIRELMYRQWSSLSTIASNSAENLQSMCRARGLVGREVEVTGHLLRGFSNKMIGRELGISHETVKVYRKRINRKLGTRSTREIYSMFFRKNF
ncbi:LuxR family transcriptional regulator [Aurantiacibacter xanthus]|uniref:LuxR family transcriptional regulator n=1 Tax=Aurantiacibacter xanthus TaxID=1784712 RepID=A0A3A1NYA0_9SPHN|nr:helix-turn-helix transcriptional regulator [Aurantiacibacter xanthus]RIV80097.1 LuxR family transcriptional regulator [Aurantiacibacter xanthus]